jgi:hypothetical protein
MAQQVSIAINVMLRLFHLKIEPKSSTVAIMHGCVDSNAAQEARKLN